MSNKKIGCLPIVMIICIVIIFSICKLYKDDSKGFKDIKENVISEDKDKNLSIKWDKLPDNCIAWIHFKNPKIISYPVMQSEDNDYYLHRNIKGKYSFAGSIFMDYNNHSDFLDKNTILYGHNMANETMFGSLKNFKEKSYWDKHNQFYIYTRNGYRLKYKIYNTVIVNPSSDIYTYKFGNVENMNSYIHNWVKKGLYKTNLLPDSKDHLISLSTCQYQGTKRLVVQAYLIEKKNIGK